MKRVFPRVYNRLVSLKWTAVLLDHARIDRKYLRKHGGVVKAGPFAGLRYVCMAKGSPLLPKLIGCYERELHEAIRLIQARNRFDVVLDVGCAEGYYVAGFAKLFGGVECYAYDIDPNARRLCSELARLNDMANRVHVRSEITAPELISRCAGRRALIISDCEGYEVNLFTAEVLPTLSLCDIICELHVGFEGDRVMHIPAMLEATHDVQIIRPAPMKKEEMPPIKGLTRGECLYAYHPARGSEDAWMVALSKRPCV